MSLGGHEVSAALQTAVTAAYDAGVTMVAASGNINLLDWMEIFYGCPVVYPAAYDEVIAVSFTGEDDRLTGYSCTGPQVDLAAPGDNITLPVPTGACMFCTPYGYNCGERHLDGVAACGRRRGPHPQRGHRRRRRRRPRRRRQGASLCEHVPGRRDGHDRPALPELVRLRHRRRGQGAHRQPARRRRRSDGPDRRPTTPRRRTRTPRPISPSWPTTPAPA